MKPLLILLCLCLNACVVATEPAPAAAPEQNTEMRDAIQAPIQKAEKVEDQVIDGAEKQRADIEAAGG
jgi:hypothetical protein